MDTSIFDLSGRVAIVTGGNGGIGRAIALGLAGAGAAVAILGRNADKSRAVVAEIEAAGGRAVAVEVDVADRARLQPAIAAAEGALGPVDILVNNAGTALIKGVLELTPEEWDRVIEVNLTACFLLARIAAQSMLARRGGKIINNASEYAVFGSAMVPSYSASKGGVLQFTKSLAIELASHNIQVNSITPGWIETDMTQPIRNTPVDEHILSRTPAGRWGRPEDCAGAAIFLASAASDFVTGSTIFVDGGYAIT
jgi:2-deoxy-D-gluconate 3-dehydrogenase